MIRIANDTLADRSAQERKTHDHYGPLSRGQRIIEWSGIVLGRGRLIG
jgi:hypothetical protein